MKGQPKKNLKSLCKYKATQGNGVRKSYQNVILDKAAVFPKPLEYSDIDDAMFNFVDNEIDLAVDGKKVPTYRLYSNQRFSEYSQMWEHSDEFGNLYLNFKTINRDKNPSFGGNQGELWNIPGSRRYTLMMKDVLESNGTESTEVYSMKQPYAVDLKYTINFVTVTNENLNKFNQKVNKLFAARQYYIRPNGHFLPMVIDEISDETEYSISDRKFYVQSVTIKLMAYIIEQDDFEVVKYPKNTNVSMTGDKKKKKTPCVEIDEYEDGLSNKTLTVNISFKPFGTKVEFDFDTEMMVEEVVTKNVMSFRMMVNDDLYYTEKRFKLHDGDNVRMVIRPIDITRESSVSFRGYDPTVFINSHTTDENVSAENPKHENINI